MDRLDAVWNNATGSKPASQLPGDVALHAVISVHGLIQSGGVLHAIESLSADELERGKRSYVWLGLADLAEHLAESNESVSADELSDGDIDALEEESNARYNAAVPDDGVLESAFRERMIESPGAFADPNRRRGWRRLVSR